MSATQTNPADKSYGSYLVWKDGKTMLFRKPPTARRLEALLSVAITVHLVIGPLIAAVLAGKPFLAAASLAGAGWVLFFLYSVAGPNDLRLDGGSTHLRADERLAVEAGDADRLILRHQRRVYVAQGSRHIPDNKAG